MTAAYPLQWPDGWPRTRSPERSRFDCTFGNACRGIIRELGLMDVGDWNIVISTNLPLRRDGLPYAGQRDPEDRGVAVYWTQKRFNNGHPDGKEQKVIACDRWDRIKDNLRAIEKTIAAMRGIDRWGSTDIVNKAFSGFVALPAPAPATWRAVFGYGPLTKPSASELQSRYYDLALKRHPDHGGSAASMIELSRAYEEAKGELRQ